MRPLGNDQDLDKLRLNSQLHDPLLAVLGNYYSR